MGKNIVRYTKRYNQYYDKIMKYKIISRKPFRLELLRTKIVRRI
jgi:hypothetical protein